MARSRVRVKVSKRFNPRVPSETVVLGKLGQLGANLLEERVRERNRDADGKPIRPLRSHGHMWVAEGDPTYSSYPGRSRREARGKPLQDGDVRRRGRKDDPGSWRNKRYVEKGYRGLKRAKGKKPVRNLDYTGKLWESLTVSLLGPTGNKRARRRKNSTRPSRKRVRKIVQKRVKLYFRGSDKSIKVTRQKRDGTEVRRSIRMRDKARAAYYGRGTRGRETPAASALRSQLTRFSNREMQILVNFFIRHVRLFS